MSNVKIKDALTKILDMLPNADFEAEGVIVLTLGKNPNPEEGSMEAAQMYAHPTTAMNLLASGYINIACNLAEQGTDLVPMLVKQLQDLLGFVEGHTSDSLRTYIKEGTNTELTSELVENGNEVLKGADDDTAKSYS